MAAGIGVVLLVPLVLGGQAMMMAGAGTAAIASGTGQCISDVDLDKIRDQVAAVLNGSNAPVVHVDGLDLPTEQIPLAQTVIATGVGLNVPVRGQIVALATALQESRLRNLSTGDRDSLGLFQQRLSQGWGTAEQIRDPVYASGRFYEALLKVPGWQQMTVAQAAQAVQKSALPDAYAQWEPLATALQTAIASTFPTAADASASAVASDCANDGSSFGPIPEGTVPEGYSIPKTTAPEAQTAILWAMQQLGTMYQWGGACTAPRGPDPMGRCDCSSLMQQAYGHAGVPLTRTTYTQVNEGKAVSTRALRPGDLLFSRGSAARPEHVAMYLGEGLVIEAPRTGRPVRIVPIKSMDVLVARRVV